MDNANAVAEHRQQQVNALAATVQTQANTIQTLQGQVQDAQAQAAAAPRRAANQKLDKFTNSEGEDEWIFYKRHFIKTCELNGYNDQEKRTALAHAMKGKAARATVDIDVDANINGFPPTFDAARTTYMVPEAPVYRVAPVDEAALIAEDVRGDECDLGQVGRLASQRHYSGAR